MYMYRVRIASGVGLAQGVWIFHKKCPYNRTHNSARSAHGVNGEWEGPRGFRLALDNFQLHVIQEFLFYISRGSAFARVSVADEATLVL